MTTGDKVYRFVKVEDYFSGYTDWPKLGDAKKCTFSEKKRAVSLSFEKGDGKHCTMFIQIAAQNTVRFRFSPVKADAKDFTDSNSRSLIMDRFQDLVNSMESFTLKWEDDPKFPSLTVCQDGEPVLELRITMSPFSFTVSKIIDGARFDMLETQDVFFTPNGDDDYHIVHSFRKPATSKYIGFGEQGGADLSRNSHQLNFFNYDNMRYRQVYDRGPFESREPLYHSDPFFMQFNTHIDRDLVGGFFVNNPSQILMDMGFLNSGRVLVGTRFWDSDIFFMAGDDASDVMTTFASFIGTPKLKPRYALGYHQGCYGYETREDVESVVDEYRKHRIPLDGMHIDVDIQNNYQTFTIDESKFPNPTEMFSNLAALGVKCATNITPVISNRDPSYKTYAEGAEKDYFLKDKRTSLGDENAYRGQDFGGGNEFFSWLDNKEGNINSGRPYIGEVYYGGDRGTPGHYADLSRIEVRKWWGKQYEYLYACGLEMVWQDMTTPNIRPSRGDMRGLPFRLLIPQDYFSGDDVHSEVAAIKAWNLYSYNLHKATLHGLNHLPGREDKRNFIVGRGSFTGMHRFAALWTGDNSSNWDFLKINVSQILSLGMSGQAMGGQDIGGFEREHDWENWADPELLIRWTAAGAFMPWFRNHYMGKKKGVKLFQEPYAYQYVDLDYWNVPQSERYLYKAVLPVCRYFIELRYRLMQLFYDALFENSINGMPICRPMFLPCGSDKTLYNDKLEFLSNQFFVGNDLLIAPVLDKQSAENGYGKREVYLPKCSDWFAFMNNKSPLQPCVEGGTTVRDYDARIESDPRHIPFVLPMYVRSGAIIPTIELEQYVGERNINGQPNPITVNVYPGEIGEYTMYLDDGSSRSSAIVSKADKKGAAKHRAVKITHQYVSEDTREIKVDRIHDNYTPKYENFYYVAVLHAPDEIPAAGKPSDNVLLDSKALPSFSYEDNGPQMLEKSDVSAWYYNPEVRITFIKVFDDKPDRTLHIIYGKKRDISNVDKAKLLLKQTSKEFYVLAEEAQKEKPLHPDAKLVYETALKLNDLTAEVVGIDEIMDFMPERSRAASKGKQGKVEQAKELLKQANLEFTRLINNMEADTPLSEQQKLYRATAELNVLTSQLLDKDEPRFVEGDVTVSNFHATVTIQGIELRGDMEFELLHNDKWVRGKRQNSSRGFGQMFIGSEWSEILVDGRRARVALPLRMYG